MKGYIRIGGSIGLGIFIILGALYVRANAPAQNTGSIVAAQAPERSYIDSKDSDGDGVKDWEEDLTTKAFETIATPSSTIQIGLDEEYTPPTTLTGKFSEAFFKDYMEGKMQGQDFSDPTAFVGTAVKAINNNTQSKQHSRLELMIVLSTPDSLREYGNQIAEIIKKRSIKNKNEAAILQQALTANDSKILEQLAPIHAVYTNYISDTLSVGVPESIIQEHINLLNAYESILTDIEAMQVAFTDPLYSLARVKGYENDALTLTIALRDIAKILNMAGITYTDDESGSFFYLFKT